MNGSFQKGGIMYSDSEPVVLFHTNGATHWQSSLVCNFCLPQESLSIHNPLFLVREFLSIIKDCSQGF